MAIVTKTLSYSFLSSFFILALISPRSQRARLYLNTFIYVSSLGVCSIFGVLCGLFLSLFGKQRFKTNYFVSRSFYLLAGTLTGIKFKVTGEEHFKDACPAVLVGNHQTGIDILYLGRIFPKFASIMAKQELKYAPLLGQFMALSGAVFINRKNKHDAIKAFDQVGNDMKRKGVSLWIFPEGTRSNLPFPDLLPFKKGAFHLAVQSGVPIVPVVCENYNRLFDGKTRFESGTINIKGFTAKISKTDPAISRSSISSRSSSSVLEPIPTKNLKTEDVNDLAQKVRELMLAELKSMDSLRDSSDSSPDGGAPPSNLGGVAKWMSYLVGTGSGIHAAKRQGEKARLQSENLKTKGTSGAKAEDYGLLSEGDRAKASATATGTEQGEGVRERRAGTSGSGSSEEVDEDGAVPLKRPVA